MCMVYLIGAGPGDPGLITVKGLSCIKKADVVVYDYLAAPALLANAREDAEIIYVGKKGGDHTLSQEGINRLLVDKAKEGKTVARLKGGDPYIFGRGGEEAEVLAAANIPFEVVPGVTSAVAAPAYAGIPLTHRRMTSTVTFVTGHEDPAKEGSSIRWKELAAGGGTLVFLMGVKNLPGIAKNLMDHGRSADTPAALVRWGTTPKQESLAATLGTIAKEAEKAGIKAPAVLVVGEVVSLRHALSWFEKKPLFGKTIVVTRSRAQASALVERLAELGARCIETPAIRVAPPEDPGPMDRAIDALSSFHWLGFTSVNGVDFFFDALRTKGLDARALGGAKVAAIGPATAARLGDFGIVPDLVPETFRAESVAEAFSGMDMEGKRVLLPRARLARPVLPVELSKMGAEVHEVVAYETLPGADDAGDLPLLLEKGEVDAVTFTSSSTVDNFARILGEADFAEKMSRTLAACIGPVTAETLEKHGVKPAVVAEQYTIAGLVDALAGHFLHAH
ncbi:MAG: uroporphyrinogen-III C-methyltransferase [Deltaproteobacteria bacterium]|nr:uroporphyrinogen-III C-methyltransferase [Deltaproteobacteria bacterium]